MKTTGRKKIFLGIGVALLGLWAAFSAAQEKEPLDAIKQSTDQILSILTDPQYEETEKKTLIRQVANQRFDWEEMARRTLGIHWRERTPAEKKQFVDLFSDLLAKNYLDKIEQYSGEKVVYENQEMDGSYAVVRGKVVTTKNMEIPLNYRLLREEDQWKVYDVVIEGVSLVSNYRSQFNSIIRRSSFEALLEKIKEKCAAMDQAAHESVAQVLQCLS